LARKKGYQTATKVREVARPTAPRRATKEDHRRDDDDDGDDGGAHLARSSKKTAGA